MRLSSGREICPNRGIFGLAIDGMITEGYDTIIDHADDDDEYSNLTNSERLEIANAQIARWTEFKAKLTSQIRTQGSNPQPVEKPAS